jgi:16S rRNA (guanine527-N7)-methyltransferase
MNGTLQTEGLLTDGLRALGLPLGGRIEAQLRQYSAAIEAWNPSHGLVGATGDELIIKHILDSLAALPIIDGLLAGGADCPTLADLGTGAGLPGIPLAIARPDMRVSLIDRMTRRIHFLESMRDTLGLANVDIIEEQVERLKGAYDIVTFRAFRPFERKLFRKVFGICATGGHVVAYKGKAGRARDELAAITGLYAEARVLPISVPFLEDERCLVVMRPVVA